MRSEERRVGKEWRSLCDWSSDVCSSDLRDAPVAGQVLVLGIPDLVGHALVEAAHPAPYGHLALLGGIPGEAQPRGQGVLAAAPQAAVEVVLPLHHEIGRASCRERVEITV